MGGGLRVEMTDVLVDGASIRSESATDQTGGTIDIAKGSLRLDNGGLISSDLADIILGSETTRLAALTLTGASKIDTHATGTANAGAIEAFVAGDINLARASKITSTANDSTGGAGSITLNATNLLMGDLDTPIAMGPSITTSGRS